MKNQNINYNIIKFENFNIIGIIELLLNKNNYFYTYNSKISTIFLEINLKDLWMLFKFNPRIKRSFFNFNKKYFHILNDKTKEILNFLKTNTNQFDYNNWIFKNNTTNNKISLNNCLNKKIKRNLIEKYSYRNNSKSQFNKGLLKKKKYSIINFGFNKSKEIKNNLNKNSHKNSYCSKTFLKKNILKFKEFSKNIKFKNFKKFKVKNDFIIRNNSLDK